MEGRKTVDKIRNSLVGFYQTELQVIVRWNQGL